jgi:TfoX/Sxy family transcriptional regulator of competence genes
MALAHAHYGYFVVRCALAVVIFVVDGMATSVSTINYILEQAAAAGNIRTRKMFGEYALYCDDKVVALVCDNQLFIKPTSAGRVLLGTVVEAPPYPGAKMYFRLDDLDDRELVSQCLRVTADALPVAKPRSTSTTRGARKK